MEERDSISATLEDLAHRDLTDQFLELSKTIGRDVATGRLLSPADAFAPGKGKQLKLRLFQLR